MILLSAGRHRKGSHGPPAGAATRGSGAPKTDPARPTGAWRQAGAGVALGCAALLAAGCAGLLAAGCAGTGRPGAAAPAAAGPSHAASAGPAASQAQRGLAARYLAIARAGNRRLETDFDGLKGRDRENLAAAQADLLDAAATERLFDRRLLSLTLPPATEAVARRLVSANEARARLAATAATCTSLGQLRLYERRLTAANKPVEEAVRVIRSQLGLPPPDVS